jgi:two-component system cell cycle response regulator DivK
MAQTVQPPQVSSQFGHLPLALLVDRDGDTRRMYATFLQQQGACEVDEAEDGREALAKALTQHPNVVVTETRLPGMNGFELCRILRSDEQTRQIPIVLVTGDAYIREKQRAAACGADAVLVKPCLPEQLAAEIRRVLGDSRDALARSRTARELAAMQVANADARLERSRTVIRRAIASRTFQRLSTTTPPIPPVTLVCPTCDRALQYLRSHIGGVSARYAEQWDYFECTGGCGTFQYRHRTRKLRRVG